MTGALSPKPWLLYALITTLFFGVWGALIELPEKAGFPATLGYSVWALTMVPCAAAALALVHWKLNRERRSVLLGLIIGLTGAGGQLILFQALRSGPAYLIFPLVSLYPVITILLSITLLKERAGPRGRIGIGLALPAIVMLSYQPPRASPVDISLWLPLAVLVFLLWGVQAYVIKVANESMSAESIFFYMTVSGLMLIPVAIAMTDLQQSINWGWRGPWLAAAIQVLNAVGALCLVYAVRYGKAIIVVPMTALAPMLTVLISLLLYRVVPGPVLIAGIALAALAMLLMAE